MDLDHLQPGDPDFDIKYLAALKELVKQQASTIDKLSAQVEQGFNVPMREALRQRDEARSHLAALGLTSEERGALALVVELAGEVLAERPPLPGMPNAMHAKITSALSVLDRLLAASTSGDSK